MLTSCRNYISKNLLLIIMVMQPFLDILAYFQEGASVSAAGYIRLAITVLVPIYALFVTKKKKRVFALLSVIGVFAALHILNGFRVGYLSFFEDVKYMLLVAHLPILLISFIHIYDKETLKSQIVTSLKANAIILMVTFVLSFVLKSGNYTYPLYQQGWTGWAQIANAQSIILVGILPFIFYLLMSQPKKRYWLCMIPVVLIYIANGTKSAYYSIYLVAIGYIVLLVFNHFLQKNKHFPIYRVGILSLIIVLTFVSYEYSPRKQVDAEIDSARQEEQNEIDHIKDEINAGEEGSQEELENYYFSHMDYRMLSKFGKEKVLAKYGEDITSERLADLRLRKRIYASLIWDETDWMTKLVGFEYTHMEYDGEIYDLENDPPAIVFYYGFIGTVLYIVFLGYFLLRVVMQLVRNFKGSMTLLNFALIEILLLQGVMSVYSGYLLRRPNVSIYLMTTLLLVYCNTEKLRKER